MYLTKCIAWLTFPCCVFLSPFHVEKREKNSIMWQKVNTVLIKETEYRILELIEGLEYSFRVYAQNDAGFSRMSDESKPTMAVSPVDPPGQPD